MIRSAAVALLLLGTAPLLHAAEPPWVQAVRRVVVPAQPASTAAVVLADETILTIAPTGELTTQYRRAVKVLTPAGRGHAYGAASFDNNTKLRGFRGWSISPVGKVHALRERDAAEMSAGDFEVYTDARIKVLDLPSEVGSIIAYEYELRERPYEAATIWRFQESIPVLKARLEAKLPVGWRHEVQWMHYAPGTEGAGPVWQLTDIPAIPDEPRMPEAASVAGRLGVQWISPATGTTSRSWGDIAKWYGALATPRLAATPPMQTTLRTLVSGAPDPTRALARFAQRDVRYVAVEIGIGGYQPHAAGEVFTNRFGDCKDKATLLKSMLREIGVESYFVIVHTSRGVVDPAFASIGSFNHVITAIRIPKEKTAGLHAIVEHPKLGTLLLFDPTSTTTPFGHLPPYLQASRGLLVGPDGGELIELPSLAPEASELRRIAKLKLDLNGTLHGTIDEIRTGDLASSMRGALQALNANERVRFVESSLDYHLARQTATDVKIENLDDPETDLIIKYQLSAPGYASRVADLILIRPRVVGSKAERTVVMAERKHSYVTEGPSLHTDDVEIVMPPTMVLDELPKTVALSNPLVQYSSSSAFANGVLHYKRRYAMQKHVVDLASIPALNEAFAKISADERASAVFK
jgi:hypothetical protein